MRTAMYTSVGGLAPGMANMLDIGISTGATTGSGDAVGSQRCRAT